MSTINAPATTAELALLAGVFSPDRMRFNCFFVALGRLLHIDSRFVAAWVEDQVNVAQLNDDEGAGLKNA